ncbi:protein lifeguard 4-like [Babylonia areolata]|uniref:protein lifeguard 4-like n=1 Tax=Babylonia areolata TaxID=304850 RepID=UPI003FD3F523
MTTPHTNPDTTKTAKSSGIVDDFMYGTNVASAHVYIRLGFLRKVYGILSVQLLVTTLMATVFLLNESIQGFVQSNSWMMLLSFIGALASLFALMWKRQETPTNYILLAVFTLMESYAVGVVVTLYNVSSVIEAFVLTLAVTAGLTAYTFQTKRDFTVHYGCLFSLLWILILAGFMQVFFPGDLMERGLALGGAVLFSFFIIIDTQMMLHKLSPEEYMLASINLYLDILNLFLHILRLLGERK